MSLLNSVELLGVEYDDPVYLKLFFPIRDDPELMARIWADSKSRLENGPGTRWIVAAAYDSTGRRVAASWAASTVRDGILRCTDSYERPGFRGFGLYELVHTVQHYAVVARWGGPAVTYVYEGPRALYAARGWRQTDSGVDREIPGNPAWFEMRRG